MQFAKIAPRFEQLSEIITDQPNYQQITIAGRLVTGIAIIGQLTADRPYWARCRTRPRTELVTHVDRPQPR